MQRRAGESSGTRRGGAAGRAGRHTFRNLAVVACTVLLLCGGTMVTGPATAGADTPVPNCVGGSETATQGCGYYITENGSSVLAGVNTISPTYITEGTAVTQTATVKAPAASSGSGTTGVFDVSINAFYGVVSSYTPTSGSGVTITATASSVTWQSSSPFPVGQTFTVNDTVTGNLPIVSPPEPYLAQCITWGSDGTANAPGQSCSQLVTAEGGSSGVTPPTASFTTQQSQSNPLSWSFDASNSTAATGHSIVTYAWNFGDGSTGTGKTTTHTYASGGTYTVRLTVTDDVGGTGTTTHTVHSGVLVVNSINDRPEVSPSDGECDTGQTVVVSGDTVPECTLRAAIAQAVADGGGDTITFNIPGGGTPVLTPATPYPPITVPMTIDGTTQPGGWVEINGSATTVGGAGLLDVTGGGTTLTGLSMVNYGGSAVYLAGGTGDMVTGDRLGVDPADAVAEDTYGIGIFGSSSATISNDVIDGVDTGIEAVPTSDGAGIGHLAITGNKVGVTPDGTALANPATTGTAGILAYSATSAPGVVITGNVVAGYDSEVLAGGAGLGLSVSGNDVGVGTGGTLLSSTGSVPHYGVRVDGSPGPSIADNDIAGARYDLALSGAVNFGVSQDEDGSTSLTVLPPTDSDLVTSPVTGTAATVTSNLIGVLGDGVTMVAPSAGENGIILFTGEGGTTITDNTVDGHTGEIGITGGSNDTIAGNQVGVGQHGEQETNPDNAGITLSNVSDSTIGGTSGNDIGDAHGTGLSLSNVTGTTVSNNLIGVGPDGSSPRPNQSGIEVDGNVTGTQIGPGNVVSGNATWGIESNAKSLRITGNDIGTTATGSQVVSNGSGVFVTQASDGDTISSNLIGGNPSAGAVNIPAANVTNAEIGIDDAASGVTISSNHIGVALGGTTALGNSIGVAVDSTGGGTIKSNVIADNQTGILSLGSAVIRTNSMYGNTAGITGSGLSPTVLLAVADRVTTGGVTRTWLAVGGLPKTGDGTIEAFGNVSCADPEGKYPLKLQTPTLGQSYQVVTIIGNANLQGFTVTYTPADGPTSSYSQCLTANTDDTDANGDGIPDSIEALGPLGPGAAADPAEADVPTDNGGWIGLQLHAAGSARLTSVAPLADPGTEPAGVSFPQGLVTFTISGLEQPGATAVVNEIVTPTTAAPTAYWKFGPTTPGGAPTWYNFAFDGNTESGATPERFQQNGNYYYGFRLDFRDGNRGDDDLTANASITDPGGPAVVAGGSTAPGYRLVGGDGGVFAFGADGFDGSATATRLHAPVVGMAATPDGRGYWLVAADGGVFTYGDARFYGSAVGSPLNAPVVGMAATPDGRGYWLVAADGGVFTYGDARFDGSAAGSPLNAPVVGMAATPDGRGYWLVAADGGVFTFGDAAFDGSEGTKALNSPVVGVSST